MNIKFLQLAQNMAIYFKNNWDFGKCDRGIVIFMATQSEVFFMECQINVPLSDADVTEIYNHNVK